MTQQGPAPPRANRRADQLKREPRRVKRLENPTFAGLGRDYFRLVQCRSALVSGEHNLP